jgi:hypothetical protein
MADWSIWKALEEWRNRRHELVPVFAQAGVSSDVESAINMVCVNLKRQPPTPPLVSGDKTRDEDTLNMFHGGVFRHFDESFFRAESLLQLPWVPEMALLADRIRGEITRLRQVLLEHPGKNHLNLIRAFEKLPSGLTSKYRLVLAGSDWHGPGRPECGLGRSAGGIEVPAAYLEDLDLRLGRRL